MEDGVELLVENVVDERALARARGPTDADEDPQGNFDIEVAEVVGAGTSNVQVAAVERAALNRHVNALAAREKLAGQGVWILQYLANGPLGSDAATVHARAGAKLDDVIGRPNGLLVVLHHNDRVADIAQAAERLNHLDVVFGMEANRRLVEHVEHAHQARANLRRKANALGLAAGEGPRPAREAEIIQANAHDEIEPQHQLAHDLLAGLLPLHGHGNVLEKIAQLLQVHLAQVVDGVASHGDEHARGFEPRAAAIRAIVLDHDLAQIVLHPRMRHPLAAVAAVAALDLVDDPIKSNLAPFVAPALGRARRQDNSEALALGAVEQHVHDAVRQFGKGRVQVEAVVLGQAVEDAAAPPIAVAVNRLAHKSAVDNAPALVGHQQIGMDL